MPENLFDVPTDWLQSTPEDPCAAPVAIPASNTLGFRFIPCGCDETTATIVNYDFTEPPGPLILRIQSVQCDRCGAVWTFDGLTWFIPKGTIPKEATVIPVAREGDDA